METDGTRRGRVPHSVYPLIKFLYGDIIPDGILGTLYREAMVSRIKIPCPLIRKSGFNRWQMTTEAYVQRVNTCQLPGFCVLSLESDILTCPDIVLVTSKCHHW